VVWTGVYPHMPIAVTTVIEDTFGSVFSNTRYKILCMYSCRIFYDSSRHRYDTGRQREIQIFTTLVVTVHAAACFSQHTRFSTVVQVCRTGITTVERVIDFSISDLGGGLTLGPRSPKGEMTYYPPRSTILQNFNPIAQTIYQICVTKVFSTLWPLGG